MKKTIIVLSALLALAYSCQHQPEVLPTANNGNPNNPGGGTGNCNPDSVYFENDILPILTSNCGMSGCHDAITQTEGINVASHASLINSGAVKPGNVNGSDLIEAITETDPDKKMPPPPRTPLTQEQINKLTKWIQQGAKNNKCNSGCDTTNFKFAANVLPLLDSKCKGCHSGAFPSAGISLTNYAEVKTQADNGKLLGAISHNPSYKPMPQGAPKMADCEITIIRKWIQAGAQNN